MCTGFSENVKLIFMNTIFLQLHKCLEILNQLNPHLPNMFVAFNPLHSHNIVYILKL